MRWRWGLRFGATLSRWIPLNVSMVEIFHMSRFGVVLYLLFSSMILFSQTATAEETDRPQEPTPAQIEFFEKQVRPLLAERCFKCHGAEKSQGSLRLDTRQGFFAGGDSGELIDPESVEESFFLEAISYSPDAIVEMPPDGKLKPAEIAVLTKWIRDGAPWPIPKGAAPKTAMKKNGPLFTEEEQNFWAFQPVIKPELPSVKKTDWARVPLDHFVLSLLEEQGLQPAPEAAKAVWLRRATFDLCGLPPTPAELDAFLADDAPDAYERVLDRLLASPYYGERWGRHWLDVARYADSNGMDENLAYANAFRYRDYVISAFNRDKPFDQFIIEQIAGDLLTDEADAQTVLDRQFATGFLAIGPKMLAEDDPVKMRVDIVDEQIDTIGKVFMGMTLGCARCHAHKFDPIPQEDYYSLAGIFLSTKTMENYKVVANWFERPIAAPEVVAEMKQKQQKLEQQETALKDLVDKTNRRLVRDARLKGGAYLLAGADLLRERERKQSLKSFMRSTPQQLPEGSLTLEAEDFARGNVKKDFSTYGKDIGVLVNAGQLPNFVEYDLDIPAPGGLCQLEIRLAAAESRPVNFTVNGISQNLMVAKEVTGSWTPESQAWSVAAFIDLKPGKNSIRLERAGPFPHIDKLAVIRLPEDFQRPLDADKLAAERGLLSTLIAQWADYLAKTRDDPKSPLATWHAFEKAQANLDPLFAEVQQTARRQLAERYQELFSNAESAWRDLKQSPDGKEAKKLADEKLEPYRQLLHDKQGPLASGEQLEKHYPEEQLTQAKSLRQEIKTLKESMPELPRGMGVTEDEIQNARVNIRGNHVNLGDEVPRQFLQIVAGENQTPIDQSQSGRLPFARWLVSPEHPLTSRVIVNRVWRWHFGEGIVPTPDNFGRTGEMPVNQPLLDYLAAEFIEQGWCLKQLHRRIMLSATYRMSTQYDEAAAQQDPGNQYLWRMNRRRLSAEELRDAILMVAGTLDETRGGTLLATKNHAYVTSTASVNNVPYQSHRRSVYLPVIRSGLFEMFQAFDFPDPSSSNGNRASTTVAPQALFLLNSDFMEEQSQAMAKLLLSEETAAVERIEAAYRRALGRLPRAEETEHALSFLERYMEAIAAEVPDETARRERAWQGLCRVLFSSSDFLYVD